ncbi:MAG: protein-L-isoaspartate(D-aspartate) O-methyltransferase [Chlorobi bacterium]|nr:protein-L-isoaspartate(D-aspartate) O-methyltransferase [Chlorobiota bacterium]
MKTGIFPYVIVLFLAINSSLGLSGQTDTFEMERKHMVNTQIRARGITYQPTLDAMLKVPRHLFIPDYLINQAYRDGPLPIGYGQTISQPYIVAYMTSVLKPEKSDKVLEIGTGSGYQAAVLAEIVDSVFTVEIVPELAVRAEKILKQLGYENVWVKSGDGYFGWEEHAPYDKIIVTAAPEEIPQPLIDQLKEGGKMIIPVGGEYSYQYLILVEKKKGKAFKKTMLPVRFVPFTRQKGE